MNIYSNNTWKTVVGMLKSNERTGLSEFECKERREKYGDNKVFIPYKTSVIGNIKNFLSPHIFLSFFIGAFLVYMQEYILGGITFTMVIITMLIKFFHSRSVVQKVKFMQKLNDSTAKVLRDGTEKIVKAEELVKGDIVVFSKDSLMAADIRIIQAEDLKVDEKNITGEKFLKDKFDSRIDNTVYSIEEMKNMLFKGTIIKNGEGTGVVVETGNSTHLGRMLMLLVNGTNNKHSLGKRLEKKFSGMMFISIAFSIALFGALTSVNLVEGYNILALSLFLTQSIPVVIIIAGFIYLLKKELSKKGIDLINLSTVDLIKEIQVLFMDKIGSITKEEMIVDKVYVNNKLYSAGEISYSKEVTIRRLIESIVLCNNASCDFDEDKHSGDLSEIAYLKFAHKKSVDKAFLEGSNRRIFEIPMDSDKRMITTVNKAKRGCRANCKGNVDAVLDRCKYIMVDGLQKEITNEDISRLKAIDYNLSLEGYITQAVAYRNFSYIPSVEENIENNLVFVGIIALENPLNDELEEEIESVKSRGIIPIVFTDDNKITATTIGRKAKLVSSNNRVIGGIEIYSLEKEELLDTISRTRVFARVTPELKAKIIGIFVKDNYKVAASGEGLGDLASICISRLGISKGNAPKLIKNASDVFIKNNFLKGFLKLFDLSKDIEVGINKFKSFVLGLVIAQIAALNLIPAINKSFNLSILPILLFNMIIVIPSSLLVLKSSGNEDERYILRSIVYVGLTLTALYDVSFGADLMWIFLFGIYSINYCLVNCNIGFKKKSLELGLFALSVSFLIIWSVVLMFMNSYDFSQLILLKTAAIAAASWICELIMKKWQE